MAKFRNTTPKAIVNATIEFRTDAEGLKKAKAFKGLAENPNVDLNLTFKKID